MKRTLSLILSALLLASAAVSCAYNGNGEETQSPIETSVKETLSVETSPAETEGENGSYDTSLLTEDSIAKAHIVLADGADFVMKMAADELVYHIKKVTGAEMSVVSSIAEGSFPIILATPALVPEIEALFPDDLAWLRDVGEVGSTERWGDDGFAIRIHEGKIYIFGANSRGALNGVYDFIEENLGVLWIRAYEDEGLIYDEMPTVTIEATDYREKSPFSVRSWVWGGDMGSQEWSDHFNLFMSRNKLNSSYENIHTAYKWQRASEQGMRPFITCHNVKNLVLMSPLYDPNVKEYWDTNVNGVHLDYATSGQVNFWSDLTSDAVAASVISLLDQYSSTVDIRYIGVNVEDFSGGYVYPENTQPFEYAPGQVVNPGELDYLSTVFYTFLNKVARQVKEKYPDVIVTTFAYTIAQTPPRCELEDNIGLFFCPITEELCYSLYDETSDNNARIYSDLEKWKEKTRNITFYNYYGTFIPSVHYCRPTWDRFQEHFLYYKENGFNGVMSEGIADYNSTHIWDTGVNHTPLTEVRWNEDTPYLCSDTWEMNALPFWIYHKLSWNPEEDVDALIVEFCDKVYGDASEHMQEFYRLLEIGWTEGTKSLAEEFNVPMKWNQIIVAYADYFLNNYDFEGNELAENLTDRILDALNKAWDAANDVQKERIRYIKETTEMVIEEYCEEW